LFHIVFPEVKLHEHAQEVHCQKYTNLLLHFKSKTKRHARAVDTKRNTTDRLVA